MSKHARTIRKLLDKAAATIHAGEARVFRDAARRLMAKWKITQADVDALEEAEREFSGSFGDAQAMELWEKSLAEACATIVGECRGGVDAKSGSTRGHPPQCVIIGPKRNVQAALDTYSAYRQKIRKKAKSVIATAAAFGMCPRWVGSSGGGSSGGWTAEFHGAFALGYASVLKIKAVRRRQRERPPVPTRTPPRTPPAEPSTPPPVKPFGLLLGGLCQRATMTATAHDAEPTNPQDHEHEQQEREQLMAMARWAIEAGAMEASGENFQPAAPASAPRLPPPPPPQAAPGTQYESYQWGRYVRINSQHAVTWETGVQYSIWTP